MAKIIKLHSMDTMEVELEPRDVEMLTRAYVCSGVLDDDLSQEDRSCFEGLVEIGLVENKTTPACEDAFYGYHTIYTITPAGINYLKGEVVVKEAKNGA